MFTFARRVLAAFNGRVEAQSRPPRRSRAATRARHAIGAIESLEERHLLSTITVTSLSDLVEDGDQELTLREAILIGNDSTGATSFEGVSSTDVADTIVFEDEVFTAGSGDLDSITIFLGSLLPVVTQELTINGSIDGDTARVIVDGMSESRILENASSGLDLENLRLQHGFGAGENGGAILNNAEAALHLNNVWISGSGSGLNSGSASAGGLGGGLYNAAGGAVTITNSLIAGNTADLSGGGIYNEGEMTIDGSGGNVHILTNAANGGQAGQGGGVFNSGSLDINGLSDILVIADNTAFRDGGGILSASGSAEIAEVDLRGNRAIEGSGGGLFNSGRASISRSTVRSNHAELGGGGLLNHGTLLANGVDVSTNVSRGHGGGLHNSGELRFTGDRFEGNHAHGDGGAVSNAGEATITGTDIVDNSAATDGGGIRNLGQLEISGCTLARNGAGARGGGILSGEADDPQAMLSIENSTIDENTAATGGGIYNLGMLSVASTAPRVTISQNTVENEGGGIFNSGVATIGGRGAIEENLAAVGGGLYNEAGGELTVVGSSFRANRATEHGGGLFNGGQAMLDGGDFGRNSAGLDGGAINNAFDLTINGTSISANTAGRNGGGIASGNTESEAVIVLQDGSMSGNTALAGGGVFNEGEATIIDSSLTNNTASTGGGIANLSVAAVSDSSVFANAAHLIGGGVYNAGDLTVTGSTLEDNSSISGGGIANATGGSARLTASTVEANRGSTGGGARNSGTMTITGSTFRFNGALLGGGIDSAGLLEIANTTISANSASRGGGVRAQSGTVSLRSATIARNDASVEGGGVLVGDSEVAIASTIIAENSAFDGPDIRGAVTDNGFNLIENTAGATFADGRAETTLVSVDPQLEPLRDNGGPTLTHALLPDSPAVHAGANPTEAEFDQRGSGFSRTVGPQTDIGAYEVQTFPEPEEPSLIVVGTGQGADPMIRVFGPANQLIASFQASPSSYRGGVRVATGDVNGDGVADLVASASAGGQPRVRVFDGTDLTGGTLLMDFTAYVPEFGGGVFVATGDFNNDGRADIVTGAGAGGGPHVKVFSGADLSGETLLMSLFAYDPNFGGGVEVAAGDVDGDGVDDVITGAGPGGGPHVRVFSGADLSARTELMSFYAYVPEFGGGVHVAAGDLNDDGHGDVITGAGFGGGPHVKAFSGADPSAGTLLENFFAYDPAFLGGVRVASADVSGDGIDDLITGAGPGGGPHVLVFEGLMGTESFYGAASDFDGGVYVAAAEEPSEPTPPPRDGSALEVSPDTIELAISSSSSSESSVRVESLDAVFADSDLALDLSAL